MPGIENSGLISERVNKIASFTLEFNPVEETNKVIIENGEEIVLIMQQDSHYVPTFENIDFLLEYKKNQGSPKKAIKFGEKWKKEYPGISQLFKSMW